MKHIPLVQGSGIMFSFQCHLEQHLPHALRETLGVALVFEDSLDCHPFPQIDALVNRPKAPL